jgi:gamma-glutamyltranspeptidase / glutathione hydrolase
VEGQTGAFADCDRLQKCRLNSARYTTMNHHAHILTRRLVLKLGSAGWLLLHAGRGAGGEGAPDVGGLVVGQPQGAETGLGVLAQGGNAVDAVVAAALVSGVVAISQCGIGGYGGHMIIGWPDGKVAAIDFNSAAPAAAREDMFPLDGRGRVRGAVNEFGWLAAGVPGTLAGLQLALDKFGTRPLSQLIEPAIRFARDGFPLPAGLAGVIRSFAAQFQRDPGSARLFIADGKPLAAGDTFRNPELAAMLEKLAGDNSVAAFYRGEIARVIAREFQKHGGLVSEQDLAAYQARDVKPLSIQWRGATLHTAPLTAGGLSVLQSLAVLKALAWENWDAADPKTTHARVEAMRLAWHDRLLLLGDPEATDVPTARLLSADYAEQSAERVRRAIKDQRLIPGATDGRGADGTVHLTAVDKTGMMVALTLTHGGGFGARVTVEGLGLTLGHGMSRFEPRPGHPNSPRPGRRPLNNMCPMLVFRENHPVVALGATGGRKIPNTMCDVLAPLVGRGRSLQDSAAAPRLHTEGSAALQLTKGWNEAEIEYLKRAGYAIEPGAGANLNGIARDPVTGALAHVP